MYRKLRRISCRTALLCALAASAHAAARRLVVIKLDGVPQEVLESELQRINPATGRSELPWMQRVFVREGTRLENFYVRGISLSTPSWAMLDTGRHMEIRGNAEFDRYTNHIYDYLNFFPFYVGYALSHKVDMPGVEVLDDLGIPLLLDFFPYQERYQSFQLFQRGVRWKTLQHGLQNRFSRPLRELLDEWTIGFEMGSSVEEQIERELIQKLADPRIRYLDYFSGEYDHSAHSTPDRASQRLALQRIDRLVGRVWTAIQASPLAAETVLVVVSDHGMNTHPGVYSQGYDLVRYFNSRAGGGHHVVTDRHPMTEYKLKGLDPFVSEVVTASDESLYLKGEGDQYPSALLDLDGNERASVYLRNSDWNALHVLLNEINHPATSPEARRSAQDYFFQMIERHRAGWQRTAFELHQELGALRRRIEAQRLQIQAQPKKWTPAQRDAGLDKQARRLSVEAESWREQERAYTNYTDALARLLALTPAELESRHMTPQELIPKRAMGDGNTLYDLRHYVAGPAESGLVRRDGAALDAAESFRRIDYLSSLASLAVRNNVQAEVGSRPVDFIAFRIPAASLASALPPEDATSEDGIGLYGDADHQALILSRHDSAGGLELRYLTLRSLQQDAAGSLHLKTAPAGVGFPLGLYEDPELQAPPQDRVRWLGEWHSELDWLHAVHKTRYANGIIALHEQFLRPAWPEKATTDEELLARFRLRKRRLAEPDFLVFAADHWNFNVRGFNPGGNHGSLLRVSSHSVLMLAGGDDTGIPRKLAIDEPYDSLSLAPTLLRLLGNTKETAPWPGRLIQQLLYQPARTAP